MAACNVVGKRLPIVVILGVTGAGKSRIAIEIASTFGGEIISADSMQVYKGLDIITNKVTAAERRQVPHHLIDFACPLTKMTVTQFRNTALPVIEDLHRKSKLPVIVGGTNYYIEALLWNTLIDKPSEASGSREVPIDTAPSENQPSFSGRKHYDDDPTPALERNDLITGEPVTDYRSWPLDLIYNKLKQVDPESAKTIHPNNKRKLARALEMIDQHGQTRTSLLSRQHAAEGGSDLRGPLRYPDPCILWVNCEREVLEERIYKRVDDMLEAGLIKELSDFHEEYNKHRLQENREANYESGIFQSIGFKEFHEYLLLSGQERSSDTGQGLFMKGRGGSVTPVYQLDSTDPCHWSAKVAQPAEEIISAYLKGESPSQQPVAILPDDNKAEYNECTVCNIVFTHSKEYKIHMSSRTHKWKIQKRNRQNRRLCQLLGNRQYQLQQQALSQQPSISTADHDSASSESHKSTASVTS